MTFRPLFELQITDYTLIADQILSILSTIFLYILLLWVIISLKKEKLLSKPIYIACIISILCFILFSCGSIGWSNIIFPISPSSCAILIPTCVFNYNIAKISMYWIFTLQAEILVKDSSLAFNTKLLWIYRILAAIIPSVLWTILIYESFADFKPHTLAKYSHCFPTRFSNINIASHIVTVLVWTDVCFGGFAALIFVYKLCQVTNLTNNHMTSNDSISSLKRDDTFSPHNKLNNFLLSPARKNQELVNKMRKLSVLCLIATLSTWAYALGTVYILRQCVFFIAFDGVINALCLSLLFNFSNTYYNKCCKHTFEKCFVDIICCCCIQTKKQNNKHKSNERQSMGGVSIRCNSRDVNDFSLSKSLKDNNNILMDVTYTNSQLVTQKRIDNEEIENKNDSAIENINTKDSISNERGHSKSLSSVNTMESVMKCSDGIKDKKGSFSISNSDTNKSVEFMLLDMTDDENNMNDDGYYEQDGILEEKDEKQVTDEDVNDQM